LEKGAKPNLLGLTEGRDPPLMMALSRPAMVDLLLRYGADPNQYSDRAHCTVVGAAVLNSGVSLDVVRQLMHYGASASDAKEAYLLFDQSNDPRGRDQVLAILGGH
jgi:hypothetical protein